MLRQEVALPFARGTDQLIYVGQFLDYPVNGYSEAGIREKKSRRTKRRTWLRLHLQWPALISFDRSTREVRRMGEDRPDYDDFAKQVCRRLAHLRKRDRTGRFRLRALATEVEVAAYENRHGITFPEPYRTFLLKVSNGGTGLYSLGSDFFDDSGPGPEVGDPGRPFPHRSSWNEDDDSLDLDRKLTEEEETAWEARQDTYLRPELVDGTVPLADEGCGHYMLLVVTGPERGNVWTDSRGSDEGIAPVTDARGNHVTFAEWYMTWLDELSGAGFGE